MRKIVRSLIETIRPVLRPTPDPVSNWRVKDNVHPISF